MEKAVGISMLMLNLDEFSDCRRWPRFSTTSPFILYYSRNIKPEVKQVTKARSLLNSKVSKVYRYRVLALASPSDRRFPFPSGVARPKRKKTCAVVVPSNKIHLVALPYIFLLMEAATEDRILF